MRRTSADARSRHTVRRSWIAYTILFGGSSALTAAGLHRDVHDLLTHATLPPLATGFLAGALNLAWWDLAYAVARPLRSAAVFELLPWAGIAASALSAAALLASRRWGRWAALLNLAFAAGVALLCLATFATGRETDAWRAAAAAGTLVADVGWGLYVLAARSAGAPASTHGRARAVGA